MAAKSYYGKQTFVNQSSEQTSYYRFDSKIDMDNWKNSDPKAYQSGIKPDLLRQECSKADFKEAEKLGFSTKDFKPFEPKNIKAVYAHVGHPKHPQSFGLVMSFDNPEQLKSFKEATKNDLGPNINELKVTDPRVTCARSNNLALEFKPESGLTPDQYVEKFKTQAFSALKNYPKLDPAKKAFASISQKDWKKPEIYAFGSASERKFFIDQVRQNPNITKIVNVTPISNFNPITINHAQTDRILEGNVTQQFQKMKEYLEMNNSKTANLKAPDLEELKTALSSKKPIVNQDLSSYSFQGVDLSGKAFIGCNFSGSNLSGANLSGSTLKDCMFKQSNMKGVDLSKANVSSDFYKADLSGSMLKETNFSGSKLNGVNLTGSDLSNAQLVRSSCYKANFENARINSATLAGTNFNGANFKGSDLNRDESKFKNTTYEKANFKGTALENSKIAERANPQKEQSAGNKHAQEVSR